MKILRRVVSKLFHLYYERKATGKPVRGSVLMLHSVGGADNEFNISTDEFRALLMKLKSLNTIRLENWEKEEYFYALTIDDVPEDFYINAYPLLRDNSVPFTIFVNTSLLDTKGFITREQLKEMSSSGICTVGSHGVCHSEFTLMTKDNARKDLSESKSLLEHVISKPVELFAFPYGSYYACGYRKKYFVTEIYKYGFGTIKAPITAKQILPMYYLPRINVDVAFVNNFLTT